jgi:hypothetical protein
MLQPLAEPLAQFLKHGSGAATPLFDGQMLECPIPLLQESSSTNIDGDGRVLVHIRARPLGQPRSNC